MACHVIWFRRDLRLDDHAALQEGCRRGSVLPLFILDPALLHHPETAPARVNFLLASLGALDQALRQRGGRLLVRWGDPAVELVRVVKAWGADGVMAHTDSERIVGRLRDAAVNRALRAETIPIRWIEPAGAQAELISSPQWRRAWHGAMASPAAATPARIPVPPAKAGVPERAIPTLGELNLPDSCTPLPPAGPTAALERLESFCRGPASRTYYWELSYPAARVTSGLSPYLKFGVITPRQCLQRLQQLSAAEPGRQRSAQQLISRLRWGAGMHQRFRYLPQLELRSPWSAFDEPEQDGQPLRGRAAELYAAWQEGRTGFPIVDAAARCLAAEGGWLELNFRSRAIHASFLANLCGIDWRWGALHFMRQLIDGDCPIDHSQWAMQAGTTITANNGWTRIYHPGQVAVDRCDPQGLFIRRWLPELADLTNDQLGAPPPMAAYPRPVLDYESARQQRIATLQRQRQQITDIRRGMARLPQRLTPFGLPWGQAGDAPDRAAAAEELFPPAIDLDALEPAQWPALLSWFRPGRSEEQDRGRRSPGPTAASRRRPKRGESPGQLSLELGLDGDADLAADTGATDQG